jgi:hypothetical protein
MTIKGTGESISFIPPAISSNAIEISRKNFLLYDYDVLCRFSTITYFLFVVKYTHIGRLFFFVDIFVIARLITLHHRTRKIERIDQYDTIEI